MTARNPAGTAVTSPSSTATVPTATAGTLTLTKSASTPTDGNGNGRVDAGDQISYSFRTANTGPVTLTGVAVVDAKVGATTCPSTRLAPGDVITCTTTAPYTITQADVDAGTVNNTATVTGRTPAGATATSNASSTATPTSTARTLGLTKSAGAPVDTNGDGYVAAGDTIAYGFALTNTGVQTLSGLRITDAKVGPTTCVATTLAPGASTTCSTNAPYVITQADANARTVDNTATASGTAPGGAAVTSNASSTSTPTSTLRRILLDKVAAGPVDANTSGRVDAGDTVAYSFVVTNQGLQTIGTLAINDAKVGATSCPVTSLAPNATTTCTTTTPYVITQGDVDAGSVDNLATATARGPLGTLITSNSDATSTPTSVAATLSLVKTAGAVTDVNTNGRVDAGDTLGYTFAVTNTGAQTVAGLAVVDPKVGATSCAATTLAPRAGTTCTTTAPYTITQADVDAGAVANTARVTGRNPAGGTVTSNASSTSTPTSAAATLRFDKSAAAPTDVNGNGRTDAGDRIGYTFTATNTGAVTLTVLAVNDSRVSATCSATTLAPGQTSTCTGTATITQAQVDAGAVTNTATASARRPDGTTVTSNGDTTTSSTATTATLQLVKSAGAPVDTNTSGRVDAGDRITYSFAVTSTGAQTISGLAVVDPKVGATTCAATTLAPGASTTCTTTAPYTITQADVDAGAVSNTATVTGRNPAGATVPSNASTTSTPTSTVATLSLTKTASAPTDVDADGRTDVGDRIGYTFLATNTGAVTLTTVAVADPKVGATSCPATTLAPGASTTCTTTTAYAVTQADVDAGAVTNTATVTGRSPAGATVTSNASSTSTPTATLATLALTKTAGAPTDVNANGRTDAGDRVGYTFLVTNTGVQTLSTVAITDAKVGATTCPATTLAPGASTTCATTAPYTITQADVDAGSVSNSATATGRTPANVRVVSNTSTTATPTSTVATLRLDKSAGAPADVNGNGRTDAGDRVTYTFVVTNTGAVTLTSAAVADSRVTAGCPTTTLAPGAATTCTATYTITQADVDAGTVDNTATASARRPDGAAVTSPPDSTSTAVSTLTALTLVKTAGAPTDVNANGRVDAGDRVAYGFAVSSTGTQTLTNLTVVDPKVGATTCAATTLAPGASTTCTTTAPYTITQADVDAGAVANTATVTARTPAGTTASSNASSTSTPTSTVATLALTKTAGAPVDTNGNGRVDAGDRVAYAFAVTNTGAVTQTAVAISDPKVGATSCPSTTLAPGATTTCTTTAPYTITQADVNSGSVGNTATATGRTPAGATTSSNASSTATPTSTLATLVLTKTAGTPTDPNGNGRVDAGDRVGYAFAVTNTGAVTITSLAVVDAKVGATTCGTTTLAPGASTTCTTTTPYAITQADVDAGAVANTATVTGRNPAGATITSNASSTSTPTSTVATLSLTKTAGTPTDVNGNGRTDAGDRIAYTFVVTSTGAQTVSGVAITDAKVGATSCPATTLAPGASTTCTTTTPYVITQADVDAGAVDNTATAAGRNPAGGAVTSNASSTSSPTSTAATLTLVKSAGTPVDVNGDARVDAGDRVGYTFLATNTGAQTLTGVAVVDAKVGATTCPATTLAPGASTTCATTTPYVITQADVDAGAVANTATVTARTPGGATVTSAASTTSSPTSTASGLLLDKTAGTPLDVNGNGRTDTGDRIPYTFTLTSTGAQTLTNVAVVDSRVSAACVATTLAPGASTTCIGAYVIRQADVDAGTVDNTATATGRRPNGTTVTSAPDATSTATTTLTGLALVKTAGAPVDSDADGRVDAGDRVGYSFAVSNTGAVTVSAVAIADPKVGATTCPATTLAPGATTTCTTDAPYVISQADVDAGAVTNTATATGRNPAGAAVASNVSTTSTTTSTLATLSLAKTAGAPVDSNGNGRVDAGDRIGFSFVATNTGAQTLSNVAVVDPKVGATSCPVTTLAPGASTTCTTTTAYAITQADVDAGAVTNTATVTGRSPAGATVTSNSSSTATPTATAATLTLVKTAGTPADANGNGRVDAGDRIPFSFAVANAGATTLRDVAVLDVTIGVPVACPVTTLAPGAGTTCTATYPVSQADVDAGAVTNTATASATAPNGAVVTSAASSTRTPTSTVATLGLTKTAGRPVDANGSSRIDAGDTITYTLVTTNTGALTLTGVAASDAQLPDCAPVTLAPGQSTTCVGTYTLTQADLDRGRHDNTARAAGQTPTGTAVTSAAAATSTPLATSAALSFTKTAGAPVDANADGRTDAGDTIAYTFTVGNPGTVTVAAVTVVDPTVGPVSCATRTLAPGASTTCLVTYTVTQADLDTGAVTNTARATGTSPGGAAVTSPDASTTTPTTGASTLSLRKSAGTPTDVNGNGRLDAGDTVPYRFAVTNAGTTTLTGLTVADAKVGATTCPVTTLAPGAGTTCTTTTPYVVTQADVDAGAVANAATASARDPRGTAVTSLVSTTSTPTSTTATLALTKTAAPPVDTDANGRTNAGDTITYRFAVTNTGALTLSGVTVADAKVAVSCPAGGLAPGATTTCTATYPITQADVDAGAVANTATAAGRTPAGATVASPASSTSTPTSTTSALTLDKQAGTPVDRNGDGRIAAGDRVPFSFVVTNTGDVTLTGVAVADSRVDGGAVCPSRTLAPGATTTCTAAYTITQADVDAGAVTNTATVSGRTPAGVTTTSDPDSTATPTSTVVALALVKTAAAPVDADGSGRTDAGDTVAYSFAVTNTGAQSVTGLAVLDARVPGGPTCPVTSLAPGAGTTCTAVYTLTQADVDAGSVRNTATARAADPRGAAVLSASSSATTPTSTATSVTFDKQAAGPVDANGDGRTDAGDTVAYTFVVVNTGAQTLTPLRVTDSLVAPTCPTTALAPGAELRCTATYVITQADVDAGAVLNTATASLRRPDGTTLTSAADSTTTPLLTSSALTLTKTAGAPADVNADGRTDAGDTITYAFRVTNTGSLTVRAVAVTDPRLAAPATCPTTTLAPGASTTCTATYTITQTDVDAGTVDNTATAAGTDPTGAAVVSDPSSTRTPTSRVATLALVKTAGAPVDLNGNGRTDAGDRVDYRFALTNTGAVTLAAPAVADPRLTAPAACPAGPLAPGASVVCTAPYTITQDDVDAGSVPNTATATATSPAGATVTSNASSTTTPTSTTAALSVDKQAGAPVDVDRDGRVDAGDTVAYTFVVTNTGAQRVTFLAVVDPLVTAPCGTTALAPGQSTSCTATYTITQADVDAGVVANTATVTARRPDGTTVTSQPDSTVTPVVGVQGLSLVKTAGTSTDVNTNGRLDAGDVVPYSFAVTNVGTVTVSGLGITDPQLAAAAVCPTTTLAANGTTTCTGTHTVTQAEVDAGTVRNTASARGTDPTNAPVVSAPSSTSTPTSTVATLVIDKQAGALVDVDGDGRVEAGDRLPYAFRVTNTGAVTLTGVAVRDARIPAGPACPATTLLPGASATCTATYVLTQADVDAGTVDNSARAAADDPRGRPVTSDPDTTTTPVATSSVLDLALVAGTPADANGNGLVDVGDTITYQVVLSNDGTRTLTGLTGAVTFPGAAPVAPTCPTTTLAPAASTTCLVTYTITQADVDAGSVVVGATATGTDSAGALVASDRETVTTRTATTVGLSLDKRAGVPVDVDADGRVDAGDQITYTFVVTSTGVRTVRDVVLRDALLGDSAAGGRLPCATGPLGGGGSVTCTATYTITQADVDAGSVPNTATVTGTDPAGTPVPTATDSTSTPTADVAELTLDKTAGAPRDVDGDGRISAGDRVPYTFVVVNEGSRTLTAVAVVDARLTGTVPCDVRTLAPGARATCTAEATITQADVDAGSLTNTATAVGTDPAGTTVTSRPDSTTTPTVGSGALRLDKTAGTPVDVDGDGRVDAGDRITYGLTVTSTGTATLTGVTVDDPLLGPVGCPAGPLAPGAAVACTAADHTITQAEVDAGAVVNRATASALTPEGERLTSAPATVTTRTSSASTLTLALSAAAPVDVDGDGRTDAGDTVTYTAVLTNTGAVTLTGVGVVDTVAGPVVCPRTTLLPGEQVTCTATHPITQAEVDAGAVTNVGTASGTTPTGTTTTSAPVTVTVPTATAATLTLDKSAGTPVDVDGDRRVDAGDTVRYTFVVRNTGAVTLTALAVDDSRIASAAVCDVETLAPGATATCTATYTITQDDVDAGTVDNAATVSATGPGGARAVSPTDTTSTPTSATAQLGLVKSADAPVDVDLDGRVDAGDRITYRFVLTNTGAQTLTNVVVRDARVGGVACPTTTLLPGGTTTCTAAYTITQADVDAGAVVNTATAAATDPRGGAVTSPSSGTRTPTDPTATLVMVKTAGTAVDLDGDGRIGAGDRQPYTFVVTNTGVVTLSLVDIRDARVGTVSCDVRTLVPGLRATCTANHAITQDEVDAGGVTNTATAIGVTPTGATVTSPPVTATSATSSAASVSLALSAGTPVDVDGDGRTGAGDRIEYAAVVTNTGVQTLTGVTVADSLPGTLTCPSTVLVPGAATTCTLTYTVTQADVDAGTVLETATASGTRPGGAIVSSAPATVETPTDTRAALSLIKTAGAPVDANGDGRLDAGDTVRYTFVVTSTGSVTVSGVAVRDALVGGDVTCTATSLAPGRQTTCAATYTLDQGDLDAGRVDNTATATGSSPTGAPVVSAAAATSTRLPASAALTLDKTAAPPLDTNGDGRTSAGDTVRYTFRVANPGALTLTGVGVDDALVDAPCPTTTLTPGAVTTCSGDHVLTQAEVDAGSLTNTATARGTRPDGTVQRSTPDSTDTSLATREGLRLDLRADATADTNGSGRVDVGDTLRYTFDVTNTGAVTVQGLVVDDPVLGTISCPTTTLAPGATVRCTSVYVLTQADLDTGSVVNTATVSGRTTTGTGVGSPAASVTTVLPQARGLAIDLRAAPAVDVDGDGQVDAGDTVTYTYVVTNPGTVTVAGVQVADRLQTGGLTCDAATVAPGGTLTCRATYVLTQADVDAGSVTNTATATGTDPSGDDVVAAPDSETTTTSAVSTLAVTATAGTPTDTNGDGLVDAGDVVPYRFVVVNTGTLTLTGVTVTGPRLAAPADCLPATLAPGAQAVCTGSTVVTQADVDSGAVVTTVTAAGVRPDGAAATSAPTTVRTPTATAASLQVDLRPGTPTDADGDGRVEVGDTLTSTFVVTNTGVVTVSATAVQDSRVGVVSCPGTVLAPGATLTCTATTTITQADLDAGAVVDRATAAGTAPDGTAVVALPDTETTPLATTSTLLLDLTAGAPVDANGDGRLDAGDTVTYTFAATNTGTVTLTGLTARDDLVGTATCAALTLAPGASTTCTGVHTLTQADLDAGTLVNTATVVGTTPGATTTVSDPDTTTTPLAGSTGLSLDKAAAAPVDTDRNGRIAAGDTITYTFTLVNTGTVSLTDVTVDDPSVTGLTCGATALAPGRSTTCTAVHTLTQADVDAGTVDNTATARATGPTGQPVRSGSDSTSTPVRVTGVLSLDLAASAAADTDGDGRVDAGDTVTYTTTVVNGGDSTLTGLVVDDSLPGTPVCAVTTLAPGERTTCTLTYVLTQADLDAGTVRNAATATAVGPAGTPVTSNADRTTTPLVESGALSLVKRAAAPVDANGSGRVDAGDTVAYTFTVSNPGTVTVTGVVVSDPKAGAVACPVATLTVGATTTCTATYRITQADADRGSVDNTATVSGRTPGGRTVTSLPSSTRTPTSTAASLLLDLGAGVPVDANGNGVTDAGDTVGYTVALTNTGAVTLSGVAVDAALGNPTCRTTTLAPGATTTCTTTHVLTQAEVDAGTVRNSAVAVGTGPDRVTVTSNRDTTDTPISPVSGLALTKTAAAPADTNGDGRADAGDTVGYTFVVTNTGTDSVSAVAVNDPRVAVGCPATTLAPRASLTCTASSVITQADVDAGELVNTANATATDSAGRPVGSAGAAARTALDQSAALTTDLGGVPTDVDGNGVVDAGDTIAYTVTVTNTGSVTVNGILVAAKNLPAGFGCASVSLAAGASTTCTATYTVTQADVDAGRVVTTAVASGTGPTGRAVGSNSDTETTLTGGRGELALDKTAGPVVDADNDKRLDAGDTVAYSFAITNRGTLTLTGVRVVDALLPATACPQTTLAPGATVTCTGTYVLTQADLDGGTLTNTATATATGPDGTTFTSPADTTTTPTGGTGGLDVTIQTGQPTDVDRNGLDAGDTVARTFRLRNTGTLTLTGVTVVDPATGATVCTIATLAPGESATCDAAPYVVTQADIDAGNVVLGATAAGTDADGTVRRDDASATTPLRAVSRLTVDKTATPVDTNGDQVLGAGDTITYTFLVTNAGATTVDTVAIDDARLDDGADCPATTLAPGASTTCTADYTVTANDEQLGSVDNAATATGTSPAGDDVTSAPDTTSTPFGAVSLTLVKRAGAPVDVDRNGTIGVGDTIAYTFTVTNSGARTVTAVAVLDAKAGPVTCAAAELVAGAATECATVRDHVITQADVDAGSVRNTATARATGPDGEAVVSSPASVETALAGGVSATLVKAALPVDDRNGDGRTDAGDRVAFSFTVTNTGTVTLTGVRIDDAMLADDGIDVTCPSTTLAPGATVVCTSGAYRITAADERAGQIRNTAGVRATGLGDGGVLDTDAVTITVDRRGGTGGGGDGNNGNTGGNNNGGDNGGNNDGGGTNHGNLPNTGAPFGPALPALGILLVLAGCLILRPRGPLGKKKE
ncbi:hypothetical protein GCM10009593_29220 [Microlunatus antarcticus]